MGLFFLLQQPADSLDPVIHLVTLLRSAPPSIDCTFAVTERNNRPVTKKHTLILKRERLFIRLLSSGFILLAVCHGPPWISNSRWVCPLPPPAFLLPHSLFFAPLPFDLFVFCLFFCSSSLPLTLLSLTTVQLLPQHLNPSTLSSTWIILLKVTSIF